LGVLDFPLDTVPQYDYGSGGARRSDAFCAYGAAPGDVTDVVERTKLMANLSKLPTGIQTFDEIRTEGYLYVDKTKYLVDLIDEGKAYVLSRPRGFGKSVTISTFDALFSGKRELFKGLHAEEFFDRPRYKVHPVVRLDMGSVIADAGPDVRRASLLRHVQESADRLGIDIGAMYAADALSEVIRRAAEKYKSRVVVLVDDFDKPILDIIHDPKEAEARRRDLNNFYVRIKAADEHVHFVFFTGTSRLANTGAFSGFNNLTDISTYERYAAMLGFTEEELLSNFDAHISATEQSLGKARDGLVEAMRDYYGGFAFNGTTMLYNPFSTLCFVSDPTFANHGFESGAHSLVARYMRDRKLTVEEFRGMEVSRHFAWHPGAIEECLPVGFLYQLGYLTLRPGRIDDHSLDYPNHEVHSGMSGLLIRNFLSEKQVVDAGVRIKSLLHECDVDGVVSEFNQLFAAIPYEDYDASAKGVVRRGRLKMEPREWLYRSMLYSFLLSIGLDVQAETHTRQGRSDMTIKFGNRVWVIEIEVAAAGEDVAKEADKALQALRDELDLKFEIIQYSEHSMEYSSRSRAITYVEINDGGGRKLFGAGISSSISKSSLRAVISAVNRL